MHVSYISYKEAFVKWPNLPFLHDLSVYFRKQKKFLN